MLASCASEGEHQVGESAVDISLNVRVGKLIYAVEEGEYLSVVLKEADDGLVQSGELLVRLVTSGIVSGTTVEDVATAIAGRILRNALAEREAEHSHTQRTLTVILGEGGRTVLRMRRLDLAVRGLISVSTCDGRLLYVGVTRHGSQAAQHVHHIGIREYVVAELEKLA